MLAHEQVVTFDRESQGMRATADAGKTTGVGRLFNSGDGLDPQNESAMTRNRLGEETSSPNLLQHAHNTVHCNGRKRRRPGRGGRDRQADPAVDGYAVPAIVWPCHGA